jgi:hypothetical protein
MDVHGDTLSMDGSQVGIFEEGNKISFSGLLQRHDGRRLEAQIGLWAMISCSHVCNNKDRKKERNTLKS